MKNASKYIEKIMNAFEVLIAILLLIVIILRIAETALQISGVEVAILHMEFNAILSTALGFVIGLEFTKMLCKHTPESVIDVLLFTLARHLVIYNENAVDLLLGVAGIVVLFAARKYLLSRPEKTIDKSEII